MKIFFTKADDILMATRIVFWFLAGLMLGLFLFISFAFIIFQKQHTNVVYPGITVDGINLGGKSEQEVIDFFLNQNTAIENTRFIFLSNDEIATVSAKEINYGFDQYLLAKQALAIGRSKDIFSNLSLIFQAYLNGVNLPPAYRYDETKLLRILSPIIDKMHADPINAIFAFQNGKVTAFKRSQDGQTVDLPLLNSTLNSKFTIVLSSKKPQALTIKIPIRVLKPNITTEEVNNLGIKELLSTGISLFQHSIPSRIYNITLASERLNGILVKPGETFSFNKALGDVSAFTGYQQAFIIKNGKTVLGDGGGVCQVSTTLFRALLNAGLPIVERNAHAYRVSYYEQDSPPGLDATVYSPTVDLKFKNDTSNYILIQTSVDQINQQLWFYLYGSKDGRETVIEKPTIINQIPPPPDMYQDDPTLPKDIIKQIDFAAWGARVSFTRQVTKDGKVIISDKFVSNFRPWRAVYLRGTKE
jgi:vancomycin resistance protein YoaR